MKKINNYTSDDLTFVICAYKECEYLEESIKSLKAQTQQAKIRLSTSTPNDFIYGLAEKYGIEVRVNPDGGQIKDYNFAMKQADTKLIMLMHQDEILVPSFVERVIEEMNQCKDPIIAFTNYLEMHNDVVDDKPSTMVKIKRLLLLPIQSRKLAGTRFGKRLIQRFGDPITHPTVVCVRDKMPEVCFREEFKASMDWDLWERLSKVDGSFVYVKDVLLYHRMNDENQTVKLLNGSNVRYENEVAILRRFWPKPIVKFIMHFYKGAAKYY